MSNCRTLYRLSVFCIVFELLAALLVVVTFLPKRYFSQFGMFFLIALLPVGALWLAFYLIQVRADREHLLNHKRLQTLREAGTDLYHLQRFYLTRVIPAERFVLGIAAMLGIAQLHMSRGELYGVGRTGYLLGYGGSTHVKAVVRAATLANCGRLGNILTHRQLTDMPYGQRTVAPFRAGTEITGGGCRVILSAPS